jgi:hypothetical protein
MLARQQQILCITVERGHLEREGRIDINHPISLNASDRQIEVSEMSAFNGSGLLEGTATAGQEAAFCAGTQRGARAKRALQLQLQITAAAQRQRRPAPVLQQPLTAPICAIRRLA